MDSKEADKYVKIGEAKEMTDITNIDNGDSLYSEGTNDKATLLEEPSTKSKFVSSVTCQGQPEGFRILIVGSAIFAVAVTVALIVDIYAFKHEYQHGGVSSDSAPCSSIGKDLLKKGGSAVDAAIGTLLCLEVDKPESGGIGGGGFMLVSDPDGNAGVIDFRETAPASASKDMYHKNESLAMKGGLSVAVPGSIRGYEMAHNLYGKLPWKTLFEGAIRLARKGFPISANTVKYLEKYIKSDIAHDFTPDGRIPKAGEIVKRKIFADTLELIANEGAKAFYTGRIAESVVNKVNSNHGNMTLEDLKNYKAIKREAVSTSYNGYSVLTTPPPSGGIVLTSMLNILKGFEFSPSDFAKNLTFHYITEAFKYAFAQRSLLADPDFVDLSNVTKLMESQSHGNWLRSRILDNQTFPPSHYGPYFDQEPTPGTFHVSVIGPQGDMASATGTINTGLGSNLMTDTGFILNNEMDDFAIPGISSYFQVEPSKSNFIKPGKRPLSAITPVIAIKEKDKCYSKVVLGGVGGTRITTATLLSLLNVISFDKSLNEAIDAPRYHHQLIPNVLQAEEDKFASSGESSVLAFLRSLHHNVSTYPIASYVHGVRIKSGHLTAHSDFRRQGSGAATY